MRIEHPLWRGFYLALCIVAALMVLQPADSLAPYRLDRRMLAYAGALTAGAFLAAIPGWLGKRRGGRRPSWQRCVRAFLCGGAMALAMGMAGSGGMLAALLTGSAGAFAFWGAALLAGLVTVRLMGRRRRA